MLTSRIDSTATYCLLDEGSAVFPSDSLAGMAAGKSHLLVSTSFAGQVGFAPVPFYMHESIVEPEIHWVVETNATQSLSPITELVCAALAAREASMETSIEKSAVAVRSVLRSVYELDDAGFGRSAAQEVMLFVEVNLRRNGLAEANRLLEMADTSRLSSRSMIGLIRSTSRLRDSLPAWPKAYRSSRRQVSKLGKNPDALFIGLPVESDDFDGAEEAR